MSIDLPLTNLLPPWLSVSVILAILTTLTTATATLLYYYLARRRYTKPFASLPVPEDSGFHILYGHLPYMDPDFMRGQQWVAIRSANAQGRTGYWHTVSRGMAVTHWEDARQILLLEEYREPIRILDKHLKQFLGYHSLLTLHDKVWKHHRSAIAKTFTTTGLASYRESMAHVVETMCQSLLTKIDSLGMNSLETLIEPIMKMITMDVFGLAAFSTDFGSSKTITPSPFATAFDTLAAGMTHRFDTNPLRPTNYFYSLPTQANKDYHAAQSLLRNFLTEQVRQRTLHPENYAAMNRKDLLTYMVEAHQSSKEQVSGWNDTHQVDQVLTDIMMTLLFAGYDTTSITLSYALYLVSQHSSVYETCLKEIDAADSLSSTEYLQYCLAVVREALRLYPPAPATRRLTRKDITLHDGFVIPKGTTVFIPIWYHRLEHNFPCGEEFLPERWVERNDTGAWTERRRSSGDILKANPQAFFAFSGGARNCPGGRFALQEATIVLAGLLKYLRFDALPGYKLTPSKVAVVQHPGDCLPMKIARRVR